MSSTLSWSCRVWSLCKQDQMSNTLSWSCRVWSLCKQDQMSSTLSWSCRVWSLCKQDQMSDTLSWSCRVWSLCKQDQISSTLDLAGSDCCARQPVGAAGLHAVCLRTPPGSHSPGARSGWMLRGHPRSHAGPSGLHHAGALRDRSSVVDLCCTTVVRCSCICWNSSPGTSRLWHCKRSLLFTFAVFVQRFCHASVETPLDEQAVALWEMIVVHFCCVCAVILSCHNGNSCGWAGSGIARDYCHSLSLCFHSDFDDGQAQMWLLVWTSVKTNVLVSVFCASCLIKVPSCQHGLVVKLVLPPSLWRSVILGPWKRRKCDRHS